MDIYRFDKYSSVRFAKIAIVIVLAKYFESGKFSGQYTLRDLITLPTNSYIGRAHRGTTRPGNYHDDLIIFLAFIVAIEIDRLTLIKFFSVVLL
ncbi:MAG: hypothetical protein Ct9H300mP23_08940 [Nitrospinota bacterium]|nr:MAG: hypothetical protein Ct9H300mP23_08940 [Nitrospinota bacterium]